MKLGAQALDFVIAQLAPLVLADSLGISGFHVGFPFLALTAHPCDQGRGQPLGLHSVASQQCAIAPSTKPLRRNLTQGEPLIWRHVADPLIALVDGVDRDIGLDRKLRRRHAPCQFKMEGVPVRVVSPGSLGFFSHAGY
jgi:hypothetical protein